jgi:pimeloyl-ACP methyl ester carboxylesterase
MYVVSLVRRYLNFYIIIEHCVVYLHGNSGNRLEGLKCLNSVASNGFSLCVFDFAGSGQSDGEYVSLGVQESEDVVVVLATLRRHALRSFTLWGRSMGAVTALLHQSHYVDTSVLSCIVDSAFTNLRDVCVD